MFSRTASVEIDIRTAQCNGMSNYFINIVRSTSSLSPDMIAPKLIAAGVAAAFLLLTQACRTSTPPDSKAAERSNNSNAIGTTAAAPSPSTESQCDPNYSGCVPIATDVDCAGGRGDGPAFVKGPVRVIGKDIYKLDSDHDGIGCE